MTHTYGEWTITPQLPGCDSPKGEGHYEVGPAIVKYKDPEDKTRALNDACIISASQEMLYNLEVAVMLLEKKRNVNSIAVKHLIKGMKRAIEKASMPFK